MKKKLIFAALVGAFYVLPPVTAQAAPPNLATKTAKTPEAAPTQYRAQCGMIYSAAQAKKDHYVCPMDGKKMTAFKTSA